MRWWYQMLDMYCNQANLDAAAKSVQTIVAAVSTLKLTPWTATCTTEITCRSSPTLTFCKPRNYLSRCLKCDCSVFFFLILKYIKIIYFLIFKNYFLNQYIKKFKIYIKIIIFYKNNKKIKKFENMVYAVLSNVE